MARLSVLASLLLGGGSLLGLVVFLWRGSLGPVPLGLALPGALALDAALCLVFFVQHSAMIRRGFRHRLAGTLPEAYHPALYSAASGAALWLLLVLWQRSELVVWSLPGAWSWLAWMLVAAGLLLGGWGVRALGSFDALGIDAARDARRHAVARPTGSLTVRGPYRLVRHPLYAAALVIFWAHPRVTIDRLLFDLLWTLWVVTACRWEERDLVARFGDAYRRYQRSVPMLVPWRVPADPR